MNAGFLSPYRVVPLLVVMGVIFFLSHQPGDGLEALSYPGLDKAAHIIVYCVLAAAVIYAFPPEVRLLKPSKVVIFTLLFCVFHGILDEFHQSFVPLREPSWADVLADFTGALISTLIWWKGRKRRATASRWVHRRLKSLL